MRKLIILFIGLVIGTQSAFATLSKSAITQAVEDFNSSIISEMHRTGSQECINFGNDLVYEFNKAHTVFLDDQYIEAYS